MAQENKQATAKHPASVSLYCTDMSGKDLSGKDLRDERLLEANLEGANLEKENLISANLWMHDANLISARPDNARPDNARPDNVKSKRKIMTQGSKKAIKLDPITKIIASLYTINILLYGIAVPNVPLTSALLLSVVITVQIIKNIPHPSMFLIITLTIDAILIGIITENATLAIVLIISITVLMEILRRFICLERETLKSILNLFSK